MSTAGPKPQEAWLPPDEVLRTYESRLPGSSDAIAKMLAAETRARDAVVRRSRQRMERAIGVAALFVVAMVLGGALAVRADVGEFAVAMVAGLGGVAIGGAWAWLDARRARRRSSGPHVTPPGLARLADLLAREREEMRLASVAARASEAPDE